MPEPLPVAPSPKPAEQEQEPESVEQPQPAARPVLAAEPFADDEVAGEPEAVARAGTSADTGPVADTEPVAEAEPVAETGPVAETEPVAETGPAAKTEPAAEAGPVTEAQPFADLGAEPVPVPVAEPEGAAPAGTPGIEGETGDAAAELSPIAEVPAAELRAAIEAILLVVDDPVGELMLAQVLEQPIERIGAELSALAEEYERQERGFDLRRAAGGWRLYTRTRYAPYVERFVLDGQSVRLTQAALETLAVVAYKQPVTRSRISAIRGVNCDGVMRTLVTRGLIEDCGAEPETGAHLYRTTSLFLEKLGLDSVDQLPPLAPFLPDDVDEIADAQR
ncbi:MAG TPA: SMC-Scp complex subunit ScpB [Rugosimonospora sp.]